MSTIKFDDPYGDLIRKTAHELVSDLFFSKKGKAAYNEMKRFCDSENSMGLVMEAQIISALQKLRTELVRLDNEGKKRGAPKI